MSRQENATTRSVTTAAFGFSLDNLRLVHMHPGSIRAFFLKYDEYTHAVLARTRQLTSASLTTEAITLINLKYCVAVAFLKANIGLGFLEANSYDDRTDEVLTTFLEERCGGSK